MQIPSFSRKEVLRTGVLFSQVGVISIPKLPHSLQLTSCSFRDIYQEAVLGTSDVTQCNVHAIIGSDRIGHKVKMPLIL